MQSSARNDKEPTRLTN